MLHFVLLAQDAEPVLVWFWPAVYDIGPELGQQWFSVSFEFALMLTVDLNKEHSADLNHGRPVPTRLSTWQLDSDHQCKFTTTASPLL